MDGSRSLVADIKTVSGADLSPGKAARFKKVVEQLGVKHEKVTPALIVEAARPDSSPIHHMFEWNDSVAAEKFRETQARIYVWLTVGSPAQKSEPVPVLAEIAPDEEDYTKLKKVRPDGFPKVNRKALVRSAVEEFAAWRERYEHLSELSCMFKAVDDCVEQMSKACQHVWVEGKCIGCDVKKTGKATHG